MQDSKQHIFERLVFSDENDNVHKDDKYKEKHREYYIKQIHEDIVYLKRAFKKIKNKYFIDNRSVDLVADELKLMIQKISMNK